MTISRKFTLWIAGTIVVVSIPVVLIFSRTAEREEVELYKAFGRRIGPVLEQSIAAYMMTRQREHVQKIFQDLTHGDEISGIHLIDQDRVVRAGTDRSLLGTKLAPEILQCHGCHERGQGDLYYRKADILRYVQHLENKAECRGCHSGGMKYNGVIIIDFSGRDISRHVSRQIMFGYLIFVPALVLIGLVMLVLTRQLVQKRITAMINGTREMKDGSYSIRLPVTNNDEITDLSRAFNEMSEVIEERERDRELLLQQVSRSFEMWQNTFDSISDLISINDAEGRIVRTNSAFISYFGLTVSQATGTNSAEYVYGGDELPADSPVAVTLRDKRSASREVFNPKLGRYFLVMTYPYAYPEADFEGFVLVARDITQMRVQENAVRESEERFRQLAENIPEVFWIGSSDWKQILYISPAYEKVWGLPCESVYERPLSWLDNVVVADKAMLLDLIPADGVIRGSSLTFPPYRITRPDGAQRWIFARAFPIMNAQGEAYRVAGIAADITELKMAEEVQRESKEQLQLLIDRMPVGCIMWGADFTVQMWNPFAEKLFGYSSEEVLGRHAYALIVPPAVRPHVDIVWERLIRGDHTAHSVNENVTRDGRTVICEWNNTPLFSRDGEVIGVLSMVTDVTDRKRAEEAIAGSLDLARMEKAKTDSVLAAIGDGVVIMDREFRVLYQNDTITRMVGNHLGEHCYAAFEGNGSVCDGCPVARTFADGGIHISERLGNTAGEPLHVETTSSPLRDAAGNIVAGIEVVRDISQRKKHEQAIRRNFDMQSVITLILQLGLEPIPLDDILVRSLDIILAVQWLSIEAKGCIFVTEGGDKLSMKAHKGLSECIEGECRLLAFGACLCGRAAVTKEVQYASCMDERHELCSDSEPHGHYCVPIVYGGTTTGVLNLYLKEGHSRDETEIRFLEAVSNALAGIVQRRLIEQERERLVSDLDEALYKIIRAQKEWISTFDSITDMIAIIDRDFRIIRVNRAFAEYYGMIPQEVLGMTCYELVHQLGTPVNVCPHTETIQHHRKATAEIVDPKTQRTFQVTTFPYYSPQGEMAGTIHVSRDITTERDRELRLILSERLASLGQMASGIAHEINNPLAAIGGCAEGLLNRVRQDRIDKPLFENYLGIIQEEVMRCKNITGGMLTIVRQSSYEKRAVNLNELLRKTIELVNFQGRLKNVEVAERYDENLPAFHGSEGELRQAFLALVSNALDALDDYGTLTIGSETQGNEIAIRISDTGCGIPTQHLGRIFDPFFTLKSDKGGTGLGLSITNKIIANHAGTIQVFSEEGQGTTFVITFASPAIQQE